jgi:cyclic beta-1,2-glucan synthetase
MSSIRIDPVKISRLRIQNSGSMPARLRVYAYAEWVLGNIDRSTAATIVSSVDAATGALLAQNPYGLDFGERVAFLAPTAGQLGDDRPLTSSSAGMAPASTAGGAAWCGADRAALKPATIRARRSRAMSRFRPVAT